jgi:predicted Na+-dependent transporter
MFLDYPEILAVLGSGLLGLLLERPFSFLDRHYAIDVALAALVFAAAWKLDLKELRAARMSPLRWLVVLVIPALVLPAASALASLALPAGALREGISVAGIAPCEVASVGVAGMAGGEVAISAGILLGATVLSVATVGPVVSLDSSLGLFRSDRRATSASGHLIHGFSGVSPHGIISLVVTLLLVVVIPLLLGSLLGSQGAMGSADTRSGWLAGTDPAKPSWRFRKALAATGRTLRRASALVSTLLVSMLVALVASQVHLDLSYLVVAAVLVGLIAFSSGLGLLLRRETPTKTGRSILLATSMRDFAIAAGIAASAFGAKAAAPLALYGVLVLLWGMSFAGWTRRASS